MWRLTLFFLFFPLIICCHSGNSKNDVQPGESGRLPFDPHGHLVFTRHARCRMDCRHITAKEIQEVLDDGTINYAKSDPNSRPDPKWAVEGFTAEQQHLRIIIAPESDKLVVVTCIELGVEWRCDCN